MSSLEVKAPVQLQLRRFVLAKPIYMPLLKLEVHSDGCPTKIMPVWSPIIPDYACAWKPPIIPKIMLA